MDRSPYVTGILATVRRDRHPFAGETVQSFLRQDWPNLQVVVYNGTALPLSRNRRVKELKLRPMSWPEMWNLAVHNADGTYCTLLFDDCYYAPAYLPTLMQDIRMERINLLRFKEAYSVTEKAARLVDDDRIFCPLWRRLHPAVFKDQLAEFTSQFYDLNRIEAQATLVTRFVA